MVESGYGRSTKIPANLSLVWSVASSLKQESAFIESSGCEVDINSVISIRFENDVPANVTVHGNCAAAADTVFIFDKARVRIDPWAGQRIQACHKSEEINLNVQRLTHLIPAA